MSGQNFEFDFHDQISRKLESERENITDLAKETFHSLNENSDWAVEDFITKVIEINSRMTADVLQQYHQELFHELLEIARKI